MTAGSSIELKRAEAKLFFEENSSIYGLSCFSCQLLGHIKPTSMEMAFAIDNIRITITDECYDLAMTIFKQGYHRPYSMRPQ